MTTQQITNEWTKQALERINNNKGLFIPRGATNLKEAKHIDKDFLKRMIIAEGYGK